MSPVFWSHSCSFSPSLRLIISLSFPTPISTSVVKLGLLLATSLITFTRSSLSSFYSLLLWSSEWLSGQLVFGNKPRTELQDAMIEVSLAQSLCHITLFISSIILYTISLSYLFSYLSVFQSLIQVSFMNKLSCSLPCPHYSTQCFACSRWSNVWINE